MHMNEIKDALLWCVVINYGILFVWFGVFVFAYDWLYRMHTAGSSFQLKPLTPSITRAWPHTSSELFCSIWCHCLPCIRLHKVRQRFRTARVGESHPTIRATQLAD